MNRKQWPVIGLILFLVAGLLPTAVYPQTLSSIPGAPLAHEFALRDLDGKIHRLSDYRGKVVIVNFWATWCPPCRREMPSMQRAWEQLQSQGVVMLAVNVGQKEEQVWSYATEAQLTFPILLDEYGKTSSSWPVIGLPTTFVIDPQGRLVYKAVGDREWDDPALLDPIRALAGSPRPT